MIGLAAMAVSGNVARTAKAQTGEIFRDNFGYSPGATLDRVKWNGYDNVNPIGRTKFGLRTGNPTPPARVEDLPVITAPGNGSTDGYARFYCSPFHQDHNYPDAPVLFFRGTQIYTNSQFSIPPAAESFIEFNAIARGYNVPSGKEN